MTTPTEKVATAKVEAMVEEIDRQIVWSDANY